MHSVDAISSKSKLCKTVVFLGSSETGKTNILQRYTKKRFENFYMETIGKYLIDFKVWITIQKKFP
jgi:GTPase SAR1 family protein